MSTKLTPKIFVEKIRENQNNNGTLKSLFAGQFLGKFEEHELLGMSASIDKELAKRSEARAEEMKKELEAMGYEVKKKK